MGQRVFVSTLWLWASIVLTSCAHQPAEETPLCAAQREALARGAEVHLHLADLKEGTTHFALHADELVLPASTQKLLTVCAAAEALAPDATLDTCLQRLLPTSGATQAPSEVVMSGGGDALLSAAEVRRLAEQALLLLPSGPVRLSAASGPFCGPDLGEGWMWDDDLEQERVLPLRIAGSQRKDQPRDVLEVVAEVFEQAGHSTEIVLSPTPRTACKDAQLLATHRRPCRDLMRAAILDSNNLAAECLLRLVSRAEASAAAGLEGVRQALRNYGIDVARLRIADGSGYSRYNLTTMRTLTHLVRREEVTHPGRLRQWLPTAGESGTLARRFKDTVAGGRIQAKTGTLEGVTALAGFLTDCTGREFVFAMSVQNGVAPASELRAIVDGFLTTLVERGVLACALQEHTQRL
jgi:D-alanyl-D-alanine carboxypeptidase/D-alanyl-D-alanine-endopeptidase (penicillin-binding protein 4)